MWQTLAKLVSETVDQAYQLRLPYRKVFCCLISYLKYFLQFVIITYVFGSPRCYGYENLILYTHLILPHLINAPSLLFQRQDPTAIVVFLPRAMTVTFACSPTALLRVCSATLLHLQFHLTTYLPAITTFRKFHASRLETLLINKHNTVKKF